MGHRACAREWPCAFRFEESTCPQARGQSISSSVSASIPWRRKRYAGRLCPADDEAQVDRGPRPTGGSRTARPAGRVSLSPSQNGPELLSGWSFHYSRLLCVYWQPRPAHDRQFVLKLVQPATIGLKKGLDSPAGVVLICCIWYLDDGWIYQALQGMAFYLCFGQ